MKHLVLVSTLLACASAAYSSGALDFMEFSDFNAMVERCAKVLADACEDGSFYQAAADSPDNGGSLSAAAFKRLLASYGLATPEQQCITLFRGLSDSDSGVMPPRARWAQTPTI